MASASGMPFLFYIFLKSQSFLFVSRAIAVRTRAVSMIHRYVLAASRDG